MIHRLKSFVCKSFAIFFHLWHDGGPNWQRDYSLWRDEQEAKWNFVGKKKKSYVDAVKSNRAIDRPSLFKRLSFPSNYHKNYSSDRDFIRFLGKKKSFWIKKQSFGKDFSQLQSRASPPPLTGANSVPISNSKSAAPMPNTGNASSGPPRETRPPPSAPVAWPMVIFGKIARIRFGAGSVTIMDTFLLLAFPRPKDCGFTGPFPSRKVKSRGLLP